MMRGWKYVELGKICKIKGGKRLPKGHNLTERATSHPYIRARDIKEGKINFDQPVYVEDGTFEKISRYTVNEGQVILTIAGTVAEVALVTNEFDKASLTENAVKIIVDETQISSIFLKFLCQSNHIKSYFELIASGAAQPKLGIYKIQSTKINLPPLPTQHKIASILSAYDDLIENNLKRIKLLEEKAQLTYEEWFVRMKFPGHETTPINNETGLPEGWEKVKFDTVLKASNGKSFKGEYLNGNHLPVYGSNGIIGQSLIHNNEEAIVIGRVGAYCGSIKYCKGKFWATDNTITATSIDKRMPNLLAYYILEAYDLRNMAGGAAQPLLTQRLINSLEITAPKEEYSIKFNGLTENIFNLIFKLQKQNQFLKEARDILLPRLMTGMIDVEQMNIETLQPTTA